MSDRTARDGGPSTMAGQIAPRGEMTRAETLGR
jgi:hypothetical protein